MGSDQARDEFLSALDGKLHFDLKQLAFCTQYSWFGVVKKERLGIEQTNLFYNRQAACLSPNLLTFHIERRDGETEWQQSRRNAALYVDESDGRGFIGRMAFLDSDILCYGAQLDDKSDVSLVRADFVLPATEPGIERRVRFDADSGMLIIETRMPRSDSRDPDPSHPLTVCLLVPDAFRNLRMSADGSDVSIGDGAEAATSASIAVTMDASPADLERCEQVFALGIGEGPTADKIEARMAEACSWTFDSAIAGSTKWLTEALDQFSFERVPEQFHLHYAKAVYQILSNTKTPRGRISHLAAFPSRGTYCCHFLWDSCFLSRGAAQFNRKMAEDYLFALAENQEADGKFPQFICVTWNRPDASQPPLIAWAAWHLYREFGNVELLKKIYEPVACNVEWWFEKRDDDGDGLVEYLDGLESGWDDSPRFDQGRIAGVDLNSYLNREMKLLAKMAPIVGRDGEDLLWQRRADEHQKLIKTRLFDPEDGVFYDRLVAENRLQKVLTPASFIPLWCGVKIAPELATEMIARYLINPKHFFGARPFPCVAYSDRHYEPEQWWRGPVWPNIAWVMTEILRERGFERERREAVNRLLDMMTSSEDLSELYSSATGRPLGATALGWTCSVFMELCRN